MNKTCEKCIHHDVCRYPLEYRAFPDTCWKYEEERPQWILCTERLPAPEDTVLFCNQRGEVCIGCKVGIDAFIDYLTSNLTYATAWMPLPEPYKGGEAEYCPCDTCKHWAENGAIDPYGEEYCPIDHECENASLYQKKE